MLINEVMKKNLITIPSVTKLNDAYKLMHEKNIRHLPVIKEGKVLVDVGSSNGFFISKGTFIPELTGFI